MNDPQSTIDDFASRLTDLSLLTPLHTHHPLHVDNTLSLSLKSRNKLSLPCLLRTILTSISQNALPLDPTLPILHTPLTVPLKRIRPSAHAAALLPDLVESIVTLLEQTTTTTIGHATKMEGEEEGTTTSVPTLLPGDDPFPPYLTLQIDHLKRVSHYNYTTLEITSTRTITHPTHNFLDDVFNLIDDTHAFRARFGCEVRSPETVALLAAHKPARETVVPIGKNVFVHTRASGKMTVANEGRIRRILDNVRCDEDGVHVRYRGISMVVVVAWLVCLGVIGVITGVVIWVLKGGVVITALGIVQLVMLSLILSLGVGREFRECVETLFGWRRWWNEMDVVRDCGKEGRDALVAGLCSGNSVDHVVSGFGFGRGVRVGEWSYDPRFGIFVGERWAFAIRGRRWFRVVKEGGKMGRFRLFPGGRRKAFVGMPMGVRIVDGGKKMEVV